MPASPSDDSTEVLVRSFMTIIFSEIGDRTFLIAAILAMRHSRLVVFAGAFGSIFIMSMLSAAVGHLLPTLLPQKWTQASAGVLFLLFGSKMMMEAREMQSGNAKIKEEMKEAEEEIAAHDDSSYSIPLERIEEGDGDGDGEIIPAFAKSKCRRSKVAEGACNFVNLILGPVFVQAFVLTFLGEWGDRSQIATIVLGATHNVYIVTLGTIIGHMCCTALAVVGGHYVSAKISVKHVTLGGAVLFLVFGVIYLYDSLVASAEDLSIPLSPTSDS